MVKNPRTVITSGVFDLIHPGHIFLLKFAKKLAGKDGRLIVVIARDETVLRRKGRKPILSENDRLKIVNSIKYVDKAVLGFKPMSFEKIIEKYRPGIVVFGYDQERIMNAFQKEAVTKKWKIKIVKALKLLSRKNYSTTQLINKAKNIHLSER